MKTRARSNGSLVLAILLVVLALGAAAAQRKEQAVDNQGSQADSGARTLSHDETLRWIAENKAWRLARKTRPIWARPVEPDEVGKEFDTADHVKQKARDGAWLSVGVAGEPWFQTLEKIEGKYELAGSESRKFEFDTQSRTYRKYKPKETSRNWAAQVKGPGIAGFRIHPGYDPDPDLLLYSPAGGYVVKDDVPDPDRDKPKDVWLVQQSLFESTYEVAPDRTEKRE